MVSQNNNPPSLYKRFFAWMVSNVLGKYNDTMASRKKILFSDLQGNILEIGPGAGVNLAFYPPNIHWLGVEPNPAMLPYLRKEAKRLGMEIEIFQTAAEILPVSDGSMDAVVATLVLCSVTSLSQTLKEIVRVLKPCGRFVFVEHVAAPLHTRTRSLQSFIQPAWSICADGCHPDRETWAAIETAGFREVQIEHFQIIVPIVGPHIAGFAIK